MSNIVKDLEYFIFRVNGHSLFLNSNERKAGKHYFWIPFLLPSPFCYVFVICQARGYMLAYQKDGDTDPDLTELSFSKRKQTGQELIIMQFNKHDDNSMS